MRHILLYWNHICVLHRQEKTFLDALAQRLLSDEIQLEVRYFGLGYPEHMSEYLARPDAILPDLIVSADLEVFEDTDIFCKLNHSLYPVRSWIPLQSGPMLDAVERGSFLLPFLSIPLVYYTRELGICEQMRLPDWDGLAFGGINNSAVKTVVKVVWETWGREAASGLLDRSLVADMPIGAFQAVVGSSKFSFSYYITGFLILLGVLLGRFICGFLCPFGWFQELLHKIPTKKLSTKKLRPLTYLKYAVLLVMVFLLPAFLVNDVGMGDPFFCKYLCPQGVLEGAIPLSLANSGIRAALGSLFTWKFGILLAVIVLSVVFYRPFCKWLCPLGAFYALFNRVSLFQMKVDKSKCVSCGKCARACKMDVDVTKTPNHTECIRCGMCIRACPTNAVCFRYGFGDGKEKENAATLRENNNKA